MQKAGTKLTSVSMRGQFHVFFSRALPAVNADLVASVWPMLFFLSSTFAGVPGPSLVL